MNKNRRDFLKFLGVSSLTISQIGSLSSLTSCALPVTSNNIFPTSKDDLVLANGLDYYPIISWGEKINKTESFGFNNDYITYKPLSNTELLMWVNHEYANPIFVSGLERNKKNIDLERRSVGGSIIKVKKDKGNWKFIPNDKYNKGVRADTSIPFAGGVKVRGSNMTIGTCGNCAGGYTPWGTFLTCEENTDNQYGDRDRKSDKIIPPHKRFPSWEAVYPHPPEHYSWVVEIDPETAKAKKHTNLGRFAHESATCIVSNNKVCVYSGDDREDKHLYKFVSESDKNFDKGTLYVASLEQGKWLPLDRNKSPILKKHFKTQLDVLTYCREASDLIGATRLNRPEDIEINPKTGDVYIALTKNSKRGDYFGSILKISEKGADHTSLSFTHETFVMGGESSNFACPDNLAFDQNGNLWMASDMSGRSMGKGKYKSFGNNGLFVIPTSGPQAGEVIQIASAPNDAEFTGLSFSPDQKTLFISVQHPGELTKDIMKPTSTWPTGSTPRPTVVAIEGKLLESYTQKVS